jgi:hypothetical protein
VIALPEALISLDLAERCLEHALHCSTRASSTLFNEFHCSNDAQQRKKSARTQGAVLQERNGLFEQKCMRTGNRQHRLQLISA